MQVIEDDGEEYMGPVKSSAMNREAIEAKTGLKVKPCPFCNSWNIVLVVYSRAAGLGCEECLAEGPVSRTDLSYEACIQDAAARWNKRSLPQ